MNSKQGDSRIPEAASAWTKETLAYLNAFYEKGISTDFTFEKLEISPELENGHSLFNER